MREDMEIESYVWLGWGLAGGGGSLLLGQFPEPVEVFGLRRRRLASPVIGIFDESRAGRVCTS